LQSDCEYAADMPRPLVIGHRGSPHRARENTLEAFAAAREDGADGVELDVHRTVDGRLVVHHDADAPGIGVLAEHDLGAIRAVHPWIPTLAEVLDECRGLLVNVEIKNSPRDADFDPANAVADLVVALLEDRAWADDVLVSSFHLPALDRVRARAERVRTGYLTVLDPPPLDAVATARARGHGAVHPFFGVLSAETVETVLAEAHAHGVAVNTWTVNDDDDLRRLAAAGVDAVITDRPAGARAALA
jgi:glycerophosphoryl diester phosphodiesterase